MSEEDRVGKSWEGSPLDLQDGIDPYGIREIVVEFGSYELEQMAVVLGTAANRLRRNADMEL